MHRHTTRTRVFATLGVTALLGLGIGSSGAARVRIPELGTEEPPTATHTAPEQQTSRHLIALRDNRCPQAFVIVTDGRRGIAMC